MNEKPGYTASKEQLLKRLARVEGQVRGVSRMVEEDRYCIDVLTQIQASEAALHGVALGLARRPRSQLHGGEGEEEEVGGDVGLVRVKKLLTVDDVPAARAFLERHFGLRPAGEGHKNFDMLLDDDGLVLTLIGVGRSNTP